MADWDAILRGGAQGATLGLGEEAAARILAGIPLDDGTGIPREYAGGGQYAQYRDEARADNKAAEVRSPWSYGLSKAVGAAPLVIATSPLAGGGTAAARIAASGLQGGALGAVQGAGESEQTGRALARDAAVSAGVGGALGAAGPALMEIPGALRTARSAALEGLTLPGAEPVMAGAGAGAIPARATPGAGPGMDNIVRAVPPRPSATLPPVALPKAGRLPSISDEAMDLAEARLRQTEANWAKKHADRFNPQRGTIPAKARPRPAPDAHIPDEKLDYLRTGMRNLDAHRSAYAGASQQEIADIAAGRIPTKNGRPFDPIQIESGSMNEGRTHVLNDGRHRLAAAREAGAPAIAATVDGKMVLLPLDEQRSNIPDLARERALRGR